MGEFTARDDKTDLRVRRDLASIERSLADSLADDLAGLVLVGGFGRGEGSVLVLEGEPRPLNDYDLVVVTRTRRDPESLQSLGDRLAPGLGVGHVDLLPMAADDLGKVASSIFAVDLARASRVLRGPRTLLAALPDHDPAALPLEEARVLVHNRLTCPLESIEERDLERPGPPSRELGMAYMISKVVLTAAEAELVLAGAYHSGYAERARRFAALPGFDPVLVTLVGEMTRFKLLPESPPPFDSRARWFDARTFYLGTIRRVAERLEGRAFPDWDRWERRHTRRGFFLARRLVNRVASGRKYRDWTRLERRRRAEAAELRVILAAAEPDRATNPHARRARRLLGALLGGASPLATWEELRRAAVLADDRFIHPRVRAGSDLFGEALSRDLDQVIG